MSKYIKDRRLYRITLEKTSCIPCHVVKTCQTDKKSPLTMKGKESAMTFHCKNYDINKDKCKKLKGECVPGRKGCVLEGRVVVSEELEEKIRELDSRMSRTSSQD